MTDHVPVRPTHPAAPLALWISIRGETWPVNQSINPIRLGSGQPVCAAWRSRATGVETVKAEEAYDAACVEYGAESSQAEAAAEEFEKVKAGLLKFRGGSSGVEVSLYMSAQTRLHHPQA